MESNRFMLECASICPETTHQKLESQCLFNPFNYEFVCEDVSEKLCRSSLN